MSVYLLVDNNSIGTKISNRTTIITKVHTNEPSRRLSAMTCATITATIAVTM